MKRLSREEKYADINTSGEMSDQTKKQIDVTIMKKKKTYQPKIQYATESSDTESQTEHYGHHQSKPKVTFSHPNVHHHSLQKKIPTAHSTVPRKTRANNPLEQFFTDTDLATSLLKNLREDVYPSDEDHDSHSQDDESDEGETIFTNMGNTKMARDDHDYTAHASFKDTDVEVDRVTTPNDDEGSPTPDESSDEETVPNTPIPSPPTTTSDTKKEKPKKDPNSQPQHKKNTKKKIQSNDSSDTKHKSNESTDYKKNKEKRKEPSITVHDLNGKFFC